MSKCSECGGPSPYQEGLETSLTIEVEKGAIEVNQVITLHLSNDAAMFYVDCANKRPEQDIDFDKYEGVLEIDLSVDEETLGVDPEKEGLTTVKISGFKGEHRAFLQWGKWGPYVAVVRIPKPVEEWPRWDKE